MVYLALEILALEINWELGIGHFTFTIVLKHPVHTFIRTNFPDAGSNTRFLIRFGSKRRRVLIFEWLTRCPTFGFLPHFSQIFAIKAHLP